MYKLDEYIKNLNILENYDEEVSSEPTWGNWLKYLMIRQKIYKTYINIQKLNEKRADSENKISEEENKDEPNKKIIFRLKEIVNSIKSRIETIKDSNLSEVTKLSNLHPKYEHLAKSYIEKMIISTNNKYTKLKLLGSQIIKDKEEYKENLNKLKSRESDFKEKMDSFLEKEETYKKQAEGNKKNEK